MEERYGLAREDEEGPNYSENETVEEFGTMRRWQMGMKEAKMMRIMRAMETMRVKMGTKTRTKVPMSDEEGHERNNGNGMDIGKGESNGSPSG